MVYSDSVVLKRWSLTIKDRHEVEFLIAGETVK